MLTTTSMPYREIGPADRRLKVSGLCLGAMNFGTTTPAETGELILDRFVEAGGTFIDSANNYNQWAGTGDESERVLGGWIKSRDARDQVVIATKCGARLRSGDDDPNVIENWEGLGSDAINAAVRGSLERLGVDRIDLYYAHYDDRTAPLEGTVTALGKLAADGVVSLVGCSNYTAWRLERARRIAADHDLPAFTVAQNEYTYLWPTPLANRPEIAGLDLLDYVAEHDDLDLVAYSALLGGSYGHLERPLPANRGYAHASAYQRFQVLREVAAALDATPNQVVLAWMLRRTPTAIPLFGASSLGQLNEALDALDLTLDDETMDRLERG